MMTAVCRMQPRFVRAIILVGLTLTTTPAFGQTAALRGFGVSYVANAPDMMGGIGGYILFDALGGLGLYLDAKFDLDSPSRADEFDSTLTAQQVENQIEGVQFLDADDSWQSFNAALVRPLSPAFMLYAGAGVATRTRYRQYRDPEGDRGLAGVFSVEAPDEQSTTVNGLVGGFLRVSRWLDFQFGIETTPRGFTVGAVIKAPPR